MVELFSGIVAFTPWVLILDLFLIIHLFVSWFLSSKKTGWKFDPWYIGLLLNFCPLFFILPFNGSKFNCISLSDVYLPSLNHSFLITALGYLFIWLGRYSFDLFKENHPFYPVVPLLRPFRKLVENNITRDKNLMFLFVFNLIFFSIYLPICLSNDSLFNPRRYFQQHEAYRPFFNFILSMIALSLNFFACRYVLNKERKFLLCFLVIFLLSISTGLRGFVLPGILSMIMFNIFKNSGKCSFIKLGALGVLLLLSAVYLSNLREGFLNPVYTIKVFLLHLLYGNNFSDVRDFAYILNYWDEKLVLGKSYFAGIISFVPRAFSDFRQEWACNVFTNSIVGFDNHPGLRSGWFGEPFLNFGYAGVMITGLIGGYFLRFIDLSLKKAIEVEKNLIKGYGYTICFSFINCFFMSISFLALYLFVLINLFVNFFSRFKLLARARNLP